MNMNKRKGGSCAPRYRHMWGAWRDFNRTHQRRECRMCGRVDYRPRHLGGWVDEEHYHLLGRENEA